MEEKLVSPLLCSMVAMVVGESTDCPTVSSAIHNGVNYKCKACGKNVCGWHSWEDEAGDIYHAECLQKHGKMTAKQKAWFGV